MMRYPYWDHKDIGWWSKSRKGKQGEPKARQRTRQGKAIIIISNGSKGLAHISHHFLSDPHLLWIIRTNIKSVMFIQGHQAALEPGNPIMRDENKPGFLWDINSRWGWRERSNVKKDVKLHRKNPANPIFNKGKNPKHIQKDHPSLPQCKAFLQF